MRAKKWPSTCTQRSTKSTRSRKVPEPRQQEAMRITRSARTMAVADCLPVGGPYLASSAETAVKIDASIPFGSAIRVCSQSQCKGKVCETPGQWYWMKGHGHRTWQEQPIIDHLPDQLHGDLLAEPPPGQAEAAVHEVVISQEVNVQDQAARPVNAPCRSPDILRGSAMQAGTISYKFSSITSIDYSQ